MHARLLSRSAALAMNKLLDEPSGWSRPVPQGLQRHVSFALNRRLIVGLMGGGGSWAHARDAALSLELRRFWCQYMQVFNRQKNLSPNYAKYGQAP